MRWTPGTKPITIRGFADSMAGRDAAKPTDRHYMIGYKDGDRLKQFSRELAEMPHLSKPGKDDAPRFR